MQVWETEVKMNTKILMNFYGTYCFKIGIKVTSSAFLYNWYIFS